MVFMWSYLVLQNNHIAYSHCLIHLKGSVAFPIRLYGSSVLK